MLEKDRFPFNPCSTFRQAGLLVDGRFGRHGGYSMWMRDWRFTLR
jgi:hypothetical protein